VAIAIHLWPSAPADEGVWSLIAQPWTPLTVTAWIELLFTSLLFATGILCITAAYRSAEVSVLAPFEYSYLLWAIVVGYLVFSDVPTVRTLLAALVIAGSGIYIAIRERNPTRN